MRPMITVEDFRRAAGRRLPWAVFDFVEGGAGDEVTHKTLGLLGVPRVADLDRSVLRGGDRA